MGKVLLAAAAYLVAMALLSRGPLGLVHIVGPRLHQGLDLVLVIGLAVSPVIARNDLDVAGVIVAEALAIILLRLAFRTRYVPAAAAVGTGGAAARAVPASREPGRSPVSEGSGSAGPPGEAAQSPAASAGDGAAAPSARRSPRTAEGGNGSPSGPAAPPATQRPVPTTAWTLGVLAARARRRRAGPDRALGEGARRLGTALGRANRRRTD
ncbi:MAG TPA: hypothetical protein VGI06_09735 [Acidimicrobiales bacterium]